MSVIAGIDFSTKAIDIVLLDEDGGGGYYQRFELATEGDAFDRTRTVRDALPTRATWEAHGVIAFGIEQPFGRGSSVTPLYRVQGAILQCLPRELLVQPWIPSAWRKACGLPGNCKKDDVAAWVKELHGDDLDWPQDGYDAYGIAYATRSVLEISEAA